MYTYYMYICICICICVYIYIYIHTHTRTYTRDTYIKTATQTHNIEINDMCLKTNSGIVLWF